MYTFFKFVIANNTKLIHKPQTEHRDLLNLLDSLIWPAKTSYSKRLPVKDFIKWNSFQLIFNMQWESAALLLQGKLYFGCHPVHGCVPQTEKFTSQVKKEEEWAHLWPEHCLMVALPLYTWVIFGLLLFGQMTALLAAFAWSSTSDSAWKKKQNPNIWVTGWFQSESKSPVSQSSRFQGLIIYDSRHLRRDGDCAFTMCTYDWRHATALNPKNRMFPGPWSQKEEVHVSVTVWLSAEWVGCGVDFPLQPTGAQRTI